MAVLIILGVIAFWMLVVLVLTSLGLTFGQAFLLVALICGGVVVAALLNG